MNRIASISVWVVVVLLAANGLRLFHTRSSISRPPVAPIDVEQPEPASMVGRVVPFTVELAETVFRNGKKNPGMKKVYAQRSDGAFVERIQLVLGPSITIDRQVILPDRILFANDFLRRVQVKKMKVPLAATLRDPKSDCMNNHLGRRISPNESRQGVEVIANHRTVQINSRGLSQWFATDLGCAMLQQKMQTAKTETSEQLAIFVLSGEPDDLLFKVPSDYVESTTKDLNIRPAGR